jgi:dTDP-4-dehydrorhamnose reductase
VSGSRVFVTGSAGLLASAIVRAFDGRIVATHTRASLDVTNPDAVARAVAAAAPDILINCAAFNDVDGAEARPQEALAVNALAVRSLALAAERAGAVLVHYSTDFVFDGEATEPYREDAKTSPQGVYAVSKLLGEWFALEAPRAYVLRVESLFGASKGAAVRRGSLDAIVEGLEAHRDVRVFTDRVVSPSHVDDIAAATKHLVDRGAAFGIYHCVNDGFATWHEVARAAAEALGVEPRLVPITMDQVSLKAPRPRFCALSTAKLASAGFPMPGWREALVRWIASRDRVSPENQRVS